MGYNFLFSNICMLVFVVFFCNKSCGNPIFEVKKYGAAGDGRTNNTGSFLDAWQQACQQGGTMTIDEGTYQIDAVEFTGPCNGQVTVQVDGTLQAPKGSLDAKDWIKFHNVDGLIIQGNGKFDGQGDTAWPDKCSDCPPLTTSLTLSSVTNAHVSDITSINSKGFHIKVNNGGGTTFQHVTITAPADSPNTDGIHISGANNVSVFDSNIGTGDDCISIGQGSHNINITGVKCGPGHGISIGSIGKNFDDASVSGVHVSGSSMTSTQNGVRIKTWTSNCAATVSGVTFEDLTIDQASNPIIIDQDYCGGHDACRGDSHVQVSDIKFIGIRGTSKSAIAVNLQCSPDKPCKNIELDNINLSLSSGKQATSSCSNVQPTYDGPQNPPSCPSSLHSYRL